MIVVADTPPITALLHLQQLHLLQHLYGTVFIPLSVAAELQSLSSFGYDISFLADEKQYRICTASNIQQVQQLPQYLDAGEAEAIVLAIEIGADLLLIDERLGKQLAEKERLACKGAIGILIEAKTKGLITSA